MVICDLDNTLYDWVGYFVPSFFAMFDKLLDILQCDREKLLDEFRAVHQKHHDAEHPFAVLETDTIQSLLQSKSFEEVIELIDPALYAFNSTRKKTLVAYSGVHDALRALKETDVELVAHTESKLYGAVDRLRRLDLEEYFSTIFCRERPETIHPNGFSVSDWLAKFPMEKIVELSKHQRKPNTRVLLEICATMGVEPAHTVYVGDSVARDMLMAKRADVYSIWASYGAQPNDELYEKLVRISHWTEEDVAREKNLKAEAEKIEPDYVLENSFDEILPALGIANRSYRRAISG